MADGTDSLSYVRASARRLGFGTLMTECQGLRAAISRVSGCVFTSQSITYRTVVNTPRRASGIGARRGLFVFRCASSVEGGAARYFVIAVPGIRDDLVASEDSGGLFYIDTSSPDVVSFVNFMINSLFCNPFGDDVVELIAAYVQFLP